ncbi:MAG: DNA gyrase subunit A [Candidatus Colwellbacteria bacterium CG10_big_fil_rev_8_21_14_0_10_41_28]|uniref:DNA gyrase subunit A n=1 Tax=Candidatus Colwellbacteria bacterium CG10_big_fil_rev_8_21_14_0_10_41_28 TaxID=1974539 RepID=A0A2H0VJ95_9BACT|nr:MAG: DNA gyrase subunit A [Candidatus Colwellbacteria bacterium CG10_big_fil_rev_8_21_14_0_10_41_28]
MAERDLKKEKHIRTTEITEELKQSYLDYAMSVIVGRALPDVRDGLKPVHRRILWAMWDSGVTFSSRYKKSANIVGEVMGRYHPHGNDPIYEALARMAQDFSLRYPLINGQGNWGNIDGDRPAAMRYTECRLSKISEALLTDIEKETVVFNSNYDDTRKEPNVLPAKFPNLLVNGSDGIAVGMATKIPPHNLTEVIDATTHLIENPKATSEDLMEFVKGPDFPTGGIVYDEKAIKEAYVSGRGSIPLRGKAEVGEKQIVVSEIPYQVNKSDLLIKMAQLVNDKKIEGIRDIRDESDKDDQVRIVIDLKNTAIPQKIMNQLWKHTDLQKDFHLNMVALADGIKPETMSIRDVLSYFVEHRKGVVTKRAEHDLRKAEERAHILEGLSKALENIDKVIETIKKSSDRDKARENLIAKFKLTEVQANAILEMRLQTLSGLETKKIEEELKEKRTLIKELKDLLASEVKILGVVKDELVQVKKDYGDDRRTRVVGRKLKDFAAEDLIPEEEAVITMSGDGYIKRLSPSIFRSQRRGGKGLIGSAVGEEDILAHIIAANTHDSILFFTDRGRVLRTKVYEIPEGSRTSRGRAIHNFLELPSEEGIAAIITYKDSKEDRKDRYFAMATAKGVVKKTGISEFDNVRKGGIIAIKLNKEDALRWVKLISKDEEIILTTIDGKAIRFKGSDVRAMGRSAAGVKGISLKAKDELVSFSVIEPGSKDNFLVVMENGYAKRTSLSEYKVQKRGGTGIVTAKVTPKTGKVVSSHVIIEEDELLAITTKGQVLKSKIKDIRQTGRATQGVKIITLKKGDKIAGSVAL